MKRDRLNIYRSPRVSDEAYLRMAIQAGKARHPFIQACNALGVRPTVTRARDWRLGRGEVLEFAHRELWWRRKHLPTLRDSA